MASVPYELERWEFDVVAGKLSGSGPVVDLGCGDGAFIRQIKQRLPELRIVGVDQNADAVERLHADGIEAYATDATDLAGLEPQSFDAVCAFQILEHAPDSMSLVRAARDLLSPAGRLFISVPNRERVGRDELEPLDCPPHHVTRWAPGQFEYLADVVGLTLYSVAFEAPEFSKVRTMHRRNVERALAWLDPRAAFQVGRAYAKLRAPQRAYERNVRTGAYGRREEFGHTMLAELGRST
jgi:SAM-dependent methyltransferase